MVAHSKTFILLQNLKHPPSESSLLSPQQHRFHKDKINVIAIEKLDREVVNHNLPIQKKRLVLVKV